MAPITRTIDVARPPEEAFAYVTDPTRFVEWQRNVVSGRMEGRARRESAPGVSPLGGSALPSGR